MKTLSAVDLMLNTTALLAHYVVLNGPWGFSADLGEFVVCII